MQQIIHNIPLIGQESQNQTLAASLAMMFSWRSGKQQSISSVSDSVLKGKPGPSLADSDLLFDSVNEILKNQGMTIISQWPFKADDLSLIIFHSPVLTAFFSNDNNRLVYTLVITGLVGDGTLNNTFVHIQDPDLKTKGKNYKISLGDFYQQFAKVVGINDNLNLEKTTAKSWYYNASPVMNITSTRSSFSSSSQSTEAMFETNVSSGRNGNKENNPNDNPFNPPGNMPF